MPHRKEHSQLDDQAVPKRSRPNHSESGEQVNMLEEQGTSSTAGQSAPNSMMVPVCTIEGEQVLVDVRIVKAFSTIQVMMGLFNESDEATRELASEEATPLQVRKDILDLIVKWSEHKLNHDCQAVNNDNFLSTERNIDITDLTSWDRQFCSRLTQDEFCDLVFAVNFLDYNYMMEHLAAYMASEMEHLTIDQIRERFGIVNDFSPQEYKRLCDETKWAFQN